MDNPKDIPVLLGIIIWRVMKKMNVTWLVCKHTRGAAASFVHQNMRRVERFPRGNDVQAIDIPYDDESLWCVN
jgi:hypothetical protein